MKKIAFLATLALILAACAPAGNLDALSHNGSNLASGAEASQTPTLTPVLATSLPKRAATATPPAAPPATQGGIPVFDHIVLIMLENQNYNSVIGSNTQMPLLNALASQNVLLTNYFAITHPSLPNYIALMSGSTQNITKDCTACYVNKPSLADLIEASGRSWKAYLDSLPAPCYVGNLGQYAQKHNPLVYFDSVRLNAARCNRSILPLTHLDADLANNSLPNFAYIMPDLCNSGHDCSAAVADKWVSGMIGKLQDSPALGNNSLIIIAFDEAASTDTSSCCGLPAPAGGQVPVVLISPSALPDVTDNTPYSHYSLLKTILTAWNLPLLGQAANASTQAITAPWTGKPTSTDNLSGRSAGQTPLASLTGTQLADSGLAFPIRAAFYYPWYPESWNQGGIEPFSHYHPTLGYYSQDDPAVIPNQIAAMQYGKIQLGIASWRAPGQFTDIRFPMLLQAGEKVGFHWSLYMESEGEGNPSVAAIQSDLQYVKDQYASSPAYLKIHGRFVVFVYGSADDNCGMIDRWTQANTVGAYLVLKTFVGYQDCQNQPDSWHQYAPASYQKRVNKLSFTISPGFWKASEDQPRLVRDLKQWNTAIRAMVASKADFQLITSFNEWGEGTAVESGSEWKSPSGYGLYLDALHYDGKVPG